MTFTATPEAGKPGIIISVLLGRTQAQGQEIPGSGSQLERKGTGTETSGLHVRPKLCLHHCGFLPLSRLPAPPAGLPPLHGGQSPEPPLFNFLGLRPPRRAGRSHWFLLRLARPSKATSANERTTTALEPRPCSGGSEGRPGGFGCAFRLLAPPAGYLRRCRSAY